jgi:hypothetical protein
MKSISLIFIVLFYAFQSFAQKNNIEFSIGSIRDKNFNLSYGNLSTAGALPVVDNRYAGLMAVTYNYKINSSFSPIITARLVLRKINYVYLDATINDFFYNTIEIPIGIRYTKTLNEQYKLRIDLCPGINYVLTNDNTTLQYIDVNTKSRLQFISDKSLHFFAQSTISFESKISENKSLILFLSYQNQFTSLFKLKSANTLFEFYSSPVNTNNISLGLAYRFSFGAKNN